MKLIGSVLTICILVLSTVYSFKIKDYLQVRIDLQADMLRKKDAELKKKDEKIKNITNELENIKSQFPFVDISNSVETNHLDYERAPTIYHKKVNVSPNYRLTREIKSFRIKIKLSKNYANVITTSNRLISVVEWTIEKPTLPHFKVCKYSLVESSENEAMGNEFLGVVLESDKNEVYSGKIPRKEGFHDIKIHTIIESEYDRYTETVKR